VSGALVVAIIGSNAGGIEEAIFGALAGGTAASLTTWQRVDLIHESAHIPDDLDIGDW
jgi:hypothetical protein